MRFEQVFKLLNLLNVTNAHQKGIILMQIQAVVKLVQSFAEYARKVIAQNVNLGIFILIKHVRDAQVLVRNVVF
jgi:hypothetical protein